MNIVVLTAGSSSKMTTTTDDIMKFLSGMSKDNEVLRKEVNDKFKSLSDKIDNVKTDAKAKEDKNEMKMNGILSRLDSIERKIEENKNNCEKDKVERSKQIERTRDFKESVGLVDKPVDKEREKTWSEIVDESREKEEEKRENEKQKKTKYWSKKVVVKEKTSKDAAAAREEVARKKAEEEKVKDDLRMKDNLHDEDDWSWSDSDLDWDGTAGKGEMNKKKKIDRYRRRKQLEAKVANKAKHMLGLGPIRKASVSYFMNIVSDYEEAKRMAVDEFLGEFLQLNEEERREFEILETITAKSDEDLLYVTFADFESVREIRTRVATIQNDTISVRNYIPPQYWARYRFLSSYCNDEREKNKNMKTMIRFNDHDLEVLMKDRSVEDHYNIVDLKEIEHDVGKIPKFDHTIQWKKRQERPPTNPAKRTSEAICPPSLRGAKSTSSSSASSAQSNKRKKLSDENMEVAVEDIASVSDKSL